jgi:hypothetical protein
MVVPPNPLMFYFHCAAETGQPRITPWWESTRMDIEEQFTSRKTFSSQVISWHKAKKEAYVGPRGDQDGDQSRRSPHPSQKLYKVLGGLLYHSARANQGYNPWITIAAKVLVPSKNLWNQKDRPDQCLDVAITLQHLPLPGGLLRLIQRYIVDQSQ